MGTATDCGYTQTVRHLIYDGGDYKLWGNITKPLSPEGSVHLKITSQWLSSKDPSAEHSKFDCMLDRDTINNFIKMFESL